MSDQVNSTQSGERTEVRLTLNGQSVSINARPLERLSTVLRDKIGLLGTKVGCDAGDCGACTVTLDDQQVCACMVPIAQVAGRSVDTIEGIGADPEFNQPDLIHPNPEGHKMVAKTVWKSLEPLLRRGKE